MNREDATRAEQILTLLDLAYQAEEQAERVLADVRIEIGTLGRELAPLLPSGPPSTLTPLQKENWGILSSLFRFPDFEPPLYVQLESKQ